MNRRRIFWIAGTALLLAVYIGSYFALVDPPRSQFERAQRIMSLKRKQSLHYPFGGKFAETVFFPIETLDQKLLRPAVWRRGMFD